MRVTQSTDQMIATNMGRALYSSEVQQPEHTTPGSFATVDRRKSLGRQRRSWAVPMFCIEVVRAVLKQMYEKS